MKTTFNNGHIAANFTQETVNSSGNKMRATRLKTQATLQREEAVKAILTESKKPGQNLDKILTDIIQRKQGVLKNYIITHGEAPDAQPLYAAVQAALIRADEIATVSTALDTDDTEALEGVEEAENEAKEISSVDKNPLDAVTQGALSLLLDYVKGRHRKRGGSGKLADVVTTFRRANATNNFTGETPDNLVNTGYNFSQWANTTTPTDAGTPVTTAAQTKTGSILSVFDTILSGIQKAGGVITNTTQQVGGAISGVKNTASDIGADSISKSLKDNLPYIIGGALLFFVLIFLIVKYGNKR